MKNNWFIFLLLSAVFFQSVAPSHAEKQVQGKVGTYPGWIIQQEVSQAGSLTIFISSVAVRCNTPMGNIVFIAPKWDCYFFSDNSRCYICFDHESWMKRLVTMQSRRNFGSSWTRSKVDSVKGFPATIYTKGDPKLPTGTLAWMSSSPEFRQAAQVVLPMLTQIGVDFPSNADGFPLQILGHNRDTGDKVQKWEWQTTSIKKANIPSSLFGFPKQYRIAKDEFEVMSASSMDEQMDLYGTMKNESKKAPVKKP